MAEFNWVWGCIDIIVVILCDRCNCLFAAHVSTIPPTWLLARKHWIPDNRSCGAFNWTCPPCYHPCCVCACVFVFLCICLLLHFIEPVHTFPSDKLCCLVPPWANWQRLCHFTYLCLQRARLRHFFISILYPHTSVCKEPDTDFCQCMRNEIFAFFWSREKTSMLSQKQHSLCNIIYKHWYI